MPFSCCFSYRTLWTHVIRAQFQTLWNPNSFTTGRPGPREDAVMSFLWSGPTPQSFRQPLPLWLQVLKSMAKITHLLWFWGAFNPATSCLWADVTVLPIPQEDDSPTGEKGPQAQLSFPETHTLPGPCGQSCPAPHHVPKEARTSWVRFWPSVWPWTRLRLSGPQFPSLHLPHRMTWVNRYQVLITVQDKSPTCGSCYCYFYHLHLS